MGTHGDQAKIRNGNLTPEQIRANKIAKTKARGIVRRAERRARAEKIDAEAKARKTQRRAG